MSKNDVPFSFWEKNRSLFQGDVIIIGGGLVGQSIAIALQKKRIKSHQRPLKICIVDKLPTGKSGASTRNAGFACFGSPTEILDDMNQETENKIVARMKNRIAGISLWKNWVSPDIIDWEDHNGYEVFEPQEIKSYEEVLNQLDNLNRMGKLASGKQYIYSKTSQISANLPYSIKINGEASLNPGKAHNALVEINRSFGIVFFNGIQISGRKNWIKTRNGWTIPSNQGDFKASKVVIATNAWTPELIPGVDITPGRGQIILIKPSQTKLFKGVCHAKKGYLYFRNLNNYLLLGGGRNLFRQEETSLDMRTTANVQTYLESYIKEVLIPKQKYTVINRWSGIMAFSRSGEKSSLIYWEEPNLLVAARMGGMGVALAPKVGEDVAKMILT